MNLYLISQDGNDNYDTYDNAVVAARDETQALDTCPGFDNGPVTDKENERRWADEGAKKLRGRDGYVWVPRGSPHITCEYLGKAKPGTVRSIICASFNAG